VKTNNQISKTARTKSFNLKQTHHSGVLHSFQLFDFSYNPITGLKRAALYTALTVSLIGTPYLAHAEENAVTSNLQAIAKSYAQESGDVYAKERWTRIEFDTTYIDPVVVVEGSIADSDQPYMVGIRNVDAMGFEVSLKNCSHSTGNPVQENVNYAVLEKSQLPLTEELNSKVRQQFSWGECALTSGLPL
jgi:hypothetical protein